MTARKKYSKEFKLDAVSLVTEQGYSRASNLRKTAFIDAPAGIAACYAGIASTGLVCIAA